MKSFKKLAGLALAMIMALALMAPAMATDLKITNANPNESYTAYKILNATISEGNASYSYTAASGWAGFLSGDTAKAVLAEVTPATNPASYKEATPAPTADQMSAFATAALAYAKSNNIASVGTAGAYNESDKSVTITDLEPGYYVIDSTMGTVCMIQTADGTQTIAEKNVTVPTPDKKQSTTIEGPGVGSVIPYTVDVTVLAGADNYVLRDTLSGGLTYNSDVTAKILTVADGDEEHNVGDNVPLTPVATKGEEDFAAQIVNVGQYPANTVIQFSYSATINAQAVTVDALTNTAKVSYGNGSETETSYTSYDLGQITINKWALAAGDGELADRRTALEGAQFKLYTQASGGTAISLILDNGAYRPATTAEIEANEELETPVDMTVIDMTNASTMLVKGLKEGTYYLEESVAPDGYNALTARQTVTLTATKGTDQGAKTVTVTDAVADVDNQTGAILPETGGIGTTIFYTLGGLLLVGSVILFVTKKRTGMAD